MSFKKTGDSSSLGIVQPNPKPEPKPDTVEIAKQPKESVSK